MHLKHPPMIGEQQLQALAEKKDAGHPDPRGEDGHAEKCPCLWRVVGAVPVGEGVKARDTTGSRLAGRHHLTAELSCGGRTFLDTFRLSTFHNKLIWGGQLPLRPTMATVLPRLGLGSVGIATYPSGRHFWIQQMSPMETSTLQ